MAVPRVRPGHVARIALFFGGFQALMPLLGWLVGAKIGGLVEAWDHWIAFVLLAGIGGKMLWEAREDGEDAAAPKAKEDELFGVRALLVLAVATSIDALAVGFTLPMLDAGIVTALLTIGITTAVLSALGLFAGRRFGAMLGKRLEIVGGVVLIGVGAKILIEHLSAG
jgi:putative Mn2+ efflux pump MntP